MRAVVDTSALLAVVLNEPERANIITATRGYDLHAPSVLPYEIGNALTSLFKRKRLSASQVQDAWDIFIQVPIELNEIDMPASLSLSSRHGIYAYDAYVIQTAIEQRTEILTLDKRMQAVAAAEGLTLLGVQAP